MSAHVRISGYSPLYGKHPARRSADDVKTAGADGDTVTVWDADGRSFRARELPGLDGQRMFVGVEAERRYAPDGKPWLLGTDAFLSEAEGDPRLTPVHLDGMEQKLAEINAILDELGRNASAG